MALRFIIDNDEFNADAVIFDKDGTLNDSITVMPEVARRRIAEIKKRFPDAAGLESKLARAIGLRDDGSIDRYSPMMIGSRLETVAAAAVVLYLSGYAQWDIAMGLARECFMAADNSIDAEKKILLLPDVNRLLKDVCSLEGKVAIATNDIRYSVDKFLNLSGLERYVHAVACSDEVNRGKPSPDLVFLAAKRLSVSPQKCVVVGDSILDIEMGIKAGVLKTIGVLTGSSTHSDFVGQANYIVNNLMNIKVLQS